MSLARRLNEALLLEMPHMIWLDKSRDVFLSVPGTDRSFSKGFDLRVEEYSPEDYNRVNIAIASSGVIGELPGGRGVFFRQLADRDPIMRPATVEEMREIPRLPDGWLSEILLADWEV